MDFWKRVELEVLKEATTFRWIAENIVHKSETTVSSWRSNNTQPRASEAVLIARALHTTVEYLVDGEEGSEYVRDLVRKEGSVFRPPDRIADVVDELIAADETTLAAVRSVIHALHPAQREHKDTG